MLVLLEEGGRRGSKRLRSRNAQFKIIVFHEETLVFLELDCVYLLELGVLVEDIDSNEGDQ